MGTHLLIEALFFDLLFGALTAWVAINKRYHPALGFVLGFFLVCFGLAIMALIPRRRLEAPQLSLRMPPQNYRAGNAPVVGPDQPWAPPADSPGWVDPRTQPAVQRVAGWYDDPYGIFTFRYWDGTDWTDHTSNGA